MAGGRPRSEWNAGLRKGGMVRLRWGERGTYHMEGAYLLFAGEGFLNPQKGNK